MNIGKSGQKYNNNKNKKPIAGDNFFKIANPKSEKGVQTDKDITEESGGFKAEATTTKKFELIGTNPALFDFVDEWVREISVKRFVHVYYCEFFFVNCNFTIWGGGRRRTIFERIFCRWGLLSLIFV